MSRGIASGRGKQGNYRDDLGDIPASLDHESVQALSKRSKQNTKTKDINTLIIEEAIGPALSLLERRMWEVVVTGALRTHKRLAHAENR